MYKIIKTTLGYEEVVKISESEAYAIKWEIKMRVLAYILLILNAYFYSFLAIMHMCYSVKCVILFLGLTWCCVFGWIIQLGTFALGKLFDDNIQS